MTRDGYDRRHALLACPRRYDDTRRVRRGQHTEQRELPARFDPDLWTERLSHAVRRGVFHRGAGVFDTERPVCQLLQDTGCLRHDVPDGRDVPLSTDGFRHHDHAGHGADGCRRLYRDDLAQWLLATERMAMQSDSWQSEVDQYQLHRARRVSHAVAAHVLIDRPQSGNADRQSCGHKWLALVHMASQLFAF